MHVSSTGGGSASGSATVSSGGRTKTAHAQVDGEGEEFDAVNLDEEEVYEMSHIDGAKESIGAKQDMEL